MFITLCQNRDKLQKYLKKFNIQSLVYYKTPLHLHKANKYLNYKIEIFQLLKNLQKKFYLFHINI